METFDDLKRQLSDESQILRLFTLGQSSLTKKDGVATIDRMRTLCERLTKEFATGDLARQAGTAVTSARGKILAAEARLAILKKAR